VVVTGSQGVIVPEELHIGRSLQKFSAAPFEIYIDRAFDEVIAACAAPRRTASGT
jgi:leucyl/phenylalanyl-tRNA--protein transferase